MISAEGVVMLGMHRSGTSAATRLVSMLGLSLCLEEDLMKDNTGNEAGHWESNSMIAVNEQVLGEMGRAWWCPPRGGAEYAESAAQIELTPAEAGARFDSVHPHSPWVWKDPRTCLTLPFWLQALDRPVAIVFVYRNPVEVAHSLHNRNRFTLPRSVATWERYNRVAFEHVRGMPVHVSRYDDLVTDPVNWCKQVHSFLDGCGLPVIVPSVETIEGFVAPRLRHSKHDRDEVVARWRSSLPVFDALESVLGSWDSFDPPELPPEASWVEAEFIAIGSVQPEPLPRPLHPYTSVIMMALGRPLAPVLASLEETLPPFCEGVVVTDAEPESVASPPATSSRVTVIHVGHDTPAGAARMAALEAVTTDVLEYREYGVRPELWWFTESRRALAAGYSAAAPQIKTNAGGVGGYGLIRVNTADGGVRWSRRPKDRLAAVPLLPQQCFVVRREALDDVGGFDISLPREGDDLGTEVYDLSVRLWRAGHRIAATRDGRVEVPDEGLWPRGGFKKYADAAADTAGTTGGKK